MPEQNGISECKNRTLVKFSQCILHTTKLSNSFWRDVVPIACYIQNQSF
jgi:hypothetical protein